MNFKLRQSDIYLFLLYFVFAIPILLFDYDYSEGWVSPVGQTIVYVLLNGISVYILVFIFFPKFFPDGKYISLFISLLLLLLLTGIISINSFCFFNSCNGIPLTFKALYLGFVTQVESISMPSCIMLGKKLFDTKLYLIRIKEEKRANELRILKSQINPHFLFNNLNTLDSLIDSDPQVAKVYVKKLAELYRYLISNTDQEVVMLEEELDFAKNYLYLILCRFGDAYHVVIEDKTQNMDGLFIPPGALQTLLENIVKHNEASSSNPMKIILDINEEKIIVSNDLNLKNSGKKSTGIGLSNLRARYKILTDKSVLIHSDHKFTVELPTIKQIT